MTKVAVIGAGPLGLMAMKNLKDDGFQVTGFDRRGYVGGLWNPSGDGNLTAMPGTVFNSSRYRAAITDFPFPDDVGDYPTAGQMKTYLNSYCDHFELRRLITLNAEVAGMKHVDGRWALSYKQPGQETKVGYFDKILVATGTFTAPKQPELKGVEKFEGKVLHSVQFRNPEQYKAQKVMLVGLHATANDVVQELKPYVSKIYIAHKTGLTMLARYGPDGKTFDQTQTLGFLFFQEFADRYFPKAFMWLVDTTLAKMSKAAFPAKAEWHFANAPSIATTAPLIADDIYPHFQSGLAEPVDAISSIVGPRSIKLTNNRIVDDVDTIIFCTGYNMSTPFIPAEYNPYASLGAPPDLYYNIFPLHANPAIRHSLAFAGQGAIPFPGFATLELQGVAISQVWKRPTLLPSLPAMQKWHANHLKWRASKLASQKVKTTFYAIFLPMPEYIRWLDSVCGTGIFDSFGWFKWRAWKLWWQDRKMYARYKKGLLSPAIWRCFDMGYGRKVWEGARERVLRDNELAELGRERRLRYVEEQRRKGVTGHVVGPIVVGGEGGGNGFGEANGHVEGKKTK